MWILVIYYPVTRKSLATTSLAIPCFIQCCNRWDKMHHSLPQIVFSKTPLNLSVPSGPNTSVVGYVTSLGRIFFPLIRWFFWLVSGFFSAWPTFCAFGISVWRWARTERADLGGFIGAQYISSLLRSQLWKQHSSTIPLWCKRLLLDPYPVGLPIQNTNGKFLC